MTLELYCKLIPIILGFPAVYFIFINDFKKDLHSQLEDLIKKNDKNYTKDIRVDYRFFASILFKITNKNWLDVFNPTSFIKKRLEYDKSAAIRGLYWSLLSILGFIMLTIYNR